MNQAYIDDGIKTIFHFRISFGDKFKNIQN